MGQQLSVVESRQRSARAATAAATAAAATAASASNNNYRDYDTFNESSFLEFQKRISSLDGLIRANRLILANRFNPSFANRASGG